MIRTVAAARRFRRGEPGRIVLVPTMGALHQGHAALIDRARRIAGKSGRVVVSIFVNPTQFGQGEDFSKYPRPWRRDLALCRSHGADMVFAPDAAELYSPDRSVFVDEAALSVPLCGGSRPGHFRGVCMVVAKLFLIVQPDDAVFGEKDWQQLAVIRRMVRDLNFPVRIAGLPTVRESDGLAVSSRNSYLTAEERAQAPGLYGALVTAAARKSPAASVATARRLLNKIPGARIDYVELVDAETLAPARNLRRAVRLACAVFLGKARLIDNVGVAPRK